MTDATKAELQTEIEALREQVAGFRAKENARPITKPLPVESIAYGKCILALDELPELRNSNYNSTGSRDTAAIGRTLRALADRYGVQLIEVRTQPCDELHLGLLDPATVGRAALGAMQYSRVGHPEF